MSDKKERKDREKAGIAAKSRLRPIFPFSYVSQGHKKRRKNYEKIKQSNPRYRDDRLKARVGFPHAFSDSCLALFLRSLCPFAAIPFPWRSADAFSSYHFCAFCAFVRLFSSYFIAFGLSSGFVTFFAEDPSCSR
jgi:hypothetical protein